MRVFRIVLINDKGHTSTLGWMPQSLVPINKLDAIISNFEMISHRKTIDYYLEYGQTDTKEEE